MEELIYKITWSKITWSKITRSKEITRKNRNEDHYTMKIIIQSRITWSTITNQESHDHMINNHKIIENNKE